MKSFNLYVSESQKTTKWTEDLVRHYHGIATVGDSFKFDKECWDLFHNKINSNRFDYFLKVGNFDLPAKPRHIPMQKHLLDSLSSQQARRPFVFSVIVTNNEAIRDKGISQIEDFVNKMDKHIRQNHFINVMRLRQMSERSQQLRQLVQKEPQDMQEALIQQQIVSSLPQLESQISFITETIEQDDGLNQELQDEFDRYYRYGRKDYKEEMAQNIMLKLRQQLSLKKKSTENFISKVVTGKEYYYVDYVEGERWPRYVPIETTKVLYPKIPSIRWIQDGPWVNIKEIMSFQQVVLEFGDAIKAKYGDVAIEKLADASLWNSSTNSTWVSTPHGGALYEGPYQGSFENGQGIEVSRVFVKVPRKIQIKYVPNKYKPDDYFRHFVNKDKIVVNVGGHYYKDGFWINRSDPKIKYASKNVETVNQSKGEFIKTKFINDVYEGVIINNDLLVNVGKKDSVYRSIDNLADVKLPVVGRTYSSIAEQPYSLIWTTKDLQELYDVVYTKRELMIALSGTKTLIADKGQKPGDLDDDEHEYQKQMGTFWIETFDPATGAPKRTNFNQWTEVDLSLSQGVTYLTEILNQLEETMGNIIGVPRQRQGQVVNTDQVGTYKESIRRAQLITEILYDDHDEVEARAQTQLLNLAIKYCYKDGTEFELNTPELGRGVYNIPPGSLKDIEFDTLVLNNTQQAQDVEDLRELMIGAWKNKELPFEAVIEAFNTESLAALRKKIEYFTAKARKLAQQMASQESENEIQKEKAKQQFANEFDSYWKKLSHEAEQMKIQVSKEKNEIDKQIADRELALKEKEIDINAMLKARELQNERQSEVEVLLNNDKHSTTDQQIKMLELKMNNLYNMASLKQQDVVEQRKEKIDLKKVEVEKEKAKKQVKEHASDK